MALFVVATPIGNLSDTTFRAVETLKTVSLIAAEDTRRTSILLNHYGIKNQMISYHDMNKERMAPKLISLLLEGKDIAIVSDSGTPGVSDPGFYLVRECVRNNIKVIPIPGPSSPISALTCSGLPTDRFTFIGFLPKKPGKFRAVIEEIKGSDDTIICFESPHRLNKTLPLMAELIPDFNIVIARELTKKFEEFIRGKVSDVAAMKREYKGEIVLVISKK